MGVVTSLLNSISSVPKNLAASLQGLKLPAPRGLSGGAIAKMASGEYWAALTERSVAASVLFAGSTAYGAVVLGASGELGKSVHSAVFPPRRGHRSGGGYDPNIHGLNN